MNDLLQTYTLLASGLRTDPQLCLANAVAWLDPMWQENDEEDIVPHDEEGTLAIALCITRKAFPDIYIQAVEAIRQGASYQTLDRMICNAITGHGIPLDNLQWMEYGVPLPAYGANLEDPDFYTNHPDVVPIMACFGVSLEPNLYHIPIPDCVYIAGRYIAADLENHSDEHYRQISWFMQWLFSCSGNSSIDFDYEAMCEFQPLSWEGDELTFAIAIIEEAEDIMSDVLTGMVLLNNHPELLEALQNNIQRIYKALEQRGIRKKLTVRLKWSPIP